MVLNFCTSPDDALYLYQVSRKYLKEFQRYWEDAVCILKFSEGDNSVNSGGEVMVLSLSTLSDSVLFVALLSYLAGIMVRIPLNIST